MRIPRELLIDLALFAQNIVILTSSSDVSIPAGIQIQNENTKSDERSAHHNQEEIHHGQEEQIAKLISEYIVHQRSYPPLPVSKTIANLGGLSCSLEADHVHGTEIGLSAPAFSLFQENFDDLSDSMKLSLLDGFSIFHSDHLAGKQSLVVAPSFAVILTNDRKFFRRTSRGIAMVEKLSLNIDPLTVSSLMRIASHFQEELAAISKSQRLSTNRSPSPISAHGVPPQNPPFIDSLFVSFPNILDHLTRTVTDTDVRSTSLVDEIVVHKSDFSDEEVVFEVMVHLPHPVKVTRLALKAPTSINPTLSFEFIRFGSTPADPHLVFCF